MDLTETFAGPNEKPTDFFDYIQSSSPQYDPDFLSRTQHRTTTDYLMDTRLHHDGFIKETNNNTLMALPPVSTITGSLGHINRNTRPEGCHLTDNDPMDLDQTDSVFWVTEDSKGQNCNMLEDLNKYYWPSTQAAPTNDHHSGLLVQRKDSPLNDTLQIHHRECTSDDRQNTDGAIYTLTVLNRDVNSMEELDGRRSPTSGAGNDGWTLETSELEVLLDMQNNAITGNADGTSTDASTGNRDHERQVVVTANGTAVDRYTAVTASQYTTDDYGVQVKVEPGDNTYGVQVKVEPGENTYGVQVKVESGENNNDWKLSDRNTLQDSVSESAESLLRNALQGKLYSGSVAGAGTTRILTDGQTGAQPNQEDPMQSVTDDLLLSQLDVDTSYRTGDYEKLKTIANEVVESYCNLEPAVCNVSATTVMYTLDPASGSLGTITLPADLAQVGTVTVVTTAPPQQDQLLQDTRHAETQPQPANNQRGTATTNLQIPGSSGTGRATGAKPKKYVRRANRQNANGAGGANGSGAGPSTSSSGSSGAGGGGGRSGSPGNVQQRKERSLHYCSICSKGFKDKYSVNVHIRTHTGEKPFSCSICNKSFRQKAHLAKHYQTHMMQKPSAAQAAQATQASQPPPPPPASSSNSAVTSNANSNNSSASTSNASSNAGSVISVPSSPAAADLQVAGARVAAVNQGSVTPTDSPVPMDTTPCNISS